MRILVLVVRAWALLGLVAGGVALSAPAAAAEADDAAKLVQTLHNSVSSVLKNPDRAAGKAEFHAILGRYFAMDLIGDRLIRRWQAQITPAQKAAYDGMIEKFLINSYAAHIYQYSDATLKVVRTNPAPGDGFAVSSLLTKPGGRPLPAVWSVVKTDKGPRVTNMMVANINLSVIQANEFDAIIQRKGFDALLALMKSRV